MAPRYEKQKKRFAAELDRVVGRSGWSKPALAAALGVVSTAVYNYCNGANLPPDARLERICDHLGVADDIREHLRTLLEAARHGPAPLDGPAGLPHRPRPFVGRQAELDRLSEWAQSAEPVVLTAVAGTPGVGKSALALNWAHTNTDRFPDGQLYLDLHGYDPVAAPMPAVEALGVLLAALRVEEIPLTLAGRESAYRLATARKRLLVVLDNASSAEQVRPLLPGDARSFVIVTSRDALAGLAAHDGARRVVVDLLTREESLTLLRVIAGDARMRAEPTAAARIAEQCARLPLALRLAAEVVVARPEVSLADLADELQEEQERFDRLDIADDPLASCRAVFSWSYGILPVELQRAFRLLGLSPGDQHDDWGLAALGGLDRVRARKSLWSLARASLVQERRSRRFEMHALLRTYGRELSAGIDSEPDRRAAVRQLADHYVVSSAAAAEAIFGARVRRVIGELPGRVAPRFPDRAAALAWMGAERPNVVATCRQTGTFGLAPQVRRLSETMDRYLGSQGLWTSLETVHEAALEVAGNPDEVADSRHRLAMLYLSTGRNDRALALHDEVIATRRTRGDVSAEAGAVGNKGLSLERLGRWEEALTHHREALDLAVRSGNLVAQADGYGNLGNVLDSLGHYDDARKELRSALDLYTRLGDEHGQARMFNNLGVISYRKEDWDGALGHFRGALARKQALGDRANEGSSRTNIGICLARLGRHDEALTELVEAEKIAREAGDTSHLASALNNLSSERAEIGDFPAAIGGHEEALALTVATGERGLEAEIRNDLGETLTKAGRPQDAVAQHRRAARLAAEVGDDLQRERAHTAMMRARSALGG